jgi:hypothetical protein
MLTGDTDKNYISEWPTVRIVPTSATYFYGNAVTHCDNLFLEGV